LGKAISTGSAIFAQLTAECPYTVQWAAPSPLKIGPSYEGIRILIYRQHCAKRKALVFKLLRSQFWRFSPRRGDTLQRWRWNLVWRVPSSVPNFTPIAATV